MESVRVEPVRHRLPPPWAAIVTALALSTTPASAQDDDSSARRPRRSTTETARWESGPSPELWAAPAAGLSIGGLTVLLGVVLGQVATANHREALDPSTTQLRASQLATSVSELSLAANVLFAVGGGIALVAGSWLVVLPFSQHRVEAPVTVSFGPSSLALSGRF